MPPKTKINSRKPRRVVRFTVRRIANKNPHNARIIPRSDKKIIRATTSLFVLILFVGGIFMTNVHWLKGDLISSENFVCEATNFANSFKEKTDRLANLLRKFPDFFAGIEECSDLANCAVVQQISEAEIKIKQLENEIATIQKNFETVREVFNENLVRVEDNVFFCPNVEICEPLEAELRTVQKCEKDFYQTARLFEIRSKVEESYMIIDAVGREQSAIELARDLNDDIFNAFERAQKNSKDYSDCVMASDASVCQEYSQHTVAAWESSANAIFSLKELRPEFERIIERLNKDIVALELGKKDSENFELNEGKGWCSQKLTESKKLLNSTIIGATDSRFVYELALENLAEKKKLYESDILAEMEAASLHAAAELAAEEEARLATEKELAEQKAAAAAELRLSVQRSQAKTLFEAWSMIRNLF